MRWPMGWRRRKAREEDLDREVRSHLELEVKEQQESGLSHDDARYAAQRAFGNTALVKEDTRAMWGSTLLDQLGQDIRYAVRTLFRQSCFHHCRRPVPGVGHRRPATDPTPMRPRYSKKPNSGSWIRFNGHVLVSDSLTAIHKQLPPLFPTKSTKPTPKPTTSNLPMLKANQERTC